MKIAKIALFDGKSIRKVWHEEEWWFSVVDVCAVLTNSLDAGAYWRKLKQRLNEERGKVVTNRHDLNESVNEPVTFCHGLKGESGNELSTICRQLKMLASDGKMRETDCANTEGVLRIIQSIPSPKAEPFKLWLARIGKERIDEIADPELAVNRAKEIYERKGYSKEWIDKRLRGIAVRNSLTDEWRDRGVKNRLEYAILTNDIMQGAFDMKVEDYKKFKDLDKENLRDHMTDLEIILTMLGEATTTEITKVKDSHGFKKLDIDAKKGGKVAGRTRKDIEEQTGKPVRSKENYLENPQSENPRFKAR
ncbi:MAG: hypothetical protein UT33_C0018G0019 [Candidatus Peregrinibacteria bacterium GW2011_GWC2_39_14]|nr:MAG: Prophage antirepressor [Candidatus Peregrinibacteria bacterium GW2011_GWA2_38_36]KKR04667.1 MAG: hypothetical protein UT33_C0018G0019 [Candidatus Peregrinibacteria bacterium GW2011_GWC2_39_14]